MFDSNNSKNLLFSASAAFILGLGSNFRIKGNSDEISLYREAMHASRALFESLNNESSTLEEVVSLIHKKRIVAKKFRDGLGFSWPL